MPFDFIGKNDSDEQVEAEAPVAPPKRTAKPTAQPVNVIDGSNRHTMVPVVFSRATDGHLAGECAEYPLWEARRLITSGCAQFAPGVAIRD